MNQRKAILLAIAVLLWTCLPITPVAPVEPSARESPSQHDVGSAGLAQPPIPGSSTPSVLSGRQTAFYGMADDLSVRNICGYADYIIVSHAVWSGGATIRDNVRYLSDHGVKVILDFTWFDVWPFPDAGVLGWEDMHMEDVVYGMNATESVKYRFGGMMSEIGPEYVWGVTIGEEEPGASTFPWHFIAWYMNLFYDWIHAAYPGIQVLQWPVPHQYATSEAYELKADGIVYDNYNQNYTEIAGIASELKSAYPTVPLFFLVSGVEHTSGWFTCHAPTYTKRAVAAIAPYAEVIGFWLTDEWGNEGWEVEHAGYKLTQRICDQIHLMDSNTIYGDTEWFECGFGNDTVTEALDNWFTSYWYQQSPDPDLSISLTNDHQVNAAAINLTCTDSGVHSYWWQYLGHYYGMPDWPGVGPYAPMNMSAASRITFWVKGFGWASHPNAQVSIFIEKSNYPLGYAGNLSLPEITSLLTDGAWHRVDIALPLDSSAYYQWDGYATQIRIEVSYTGTAPSNTTSILFDGWVVESYDTGKAYGLNTPADYVSVENGTVQIGGSAYFETHFPEADAWYYEYSGTGTIQMYINEAWATPPDEGIPCRWNASAIRLSNGSFDWVKVNAIPPLVEIQSPTDGALLSGTTQVEVDASDESGILRVEFAVDGTLRHSDYASPFTWTWDTTAFSDGLHGLNATAYATSGAVNFHDIQVVLDNTKPSIVIVVPSNNSLVQGSVPVNATASDTSGIAEVAFYVDGNLLVIDSSSPYGCVWNTLSGLDGPRNLTCRAKDQAGNMQTAYHRIIVDNTAPSIALHSILVASGQTLVAANASDPSGIARVEFFVNGSLQFTDYAYPYQWMWNTSGYVDGQYAVKCVAYDTLGHFNEVQAGVLIDRTPPSLSVIRTPPDSLVAGLVQVSATATDAHGIQSVDFYVDGQLRFTDVSSPYLWTWDTRLYLDGTHTLLVVVTDSCGNSRQVQSEVTVDNLGPAITINSPTNGSLLEGPVAMLVIATVLDPAGIQGVLLSYSTGGVWTNLSMAPSGTNYQGTVAGLTPGLTVRVRLYANDTLGNKVATGVYTYYIVDQTPPTIGSPSIVPSVPSPFDTVVVSVTVSDPSGVSRVLLAYRVDAGAWANLTMTGGPLFWQTLPAALAGSVVAYRIFANDTLNQWSSSPVYQYTVVAFDVLPPTLNDWWWSPLAPNETDTVTVSANVTDPSGVAAVTLSYHDGASWHNLSMTLQAGFYVAVLPALPYDTMVTLKVYARDAQDNWGVTPLGQYRVQTSDRAGPVTTTVTWTPLSPYENESILVTATITDASPITLALLSYYDGTSWRNLTMTAQAGSYSASIPAIGTAAIITLRIFALDNKGNWGLSDLVEFTVQALPPEQRPSPALSEIAVWAILGGAAVGVPVLVVLVIRSIRRRRH
jgi:hypothetical protein